MKYDSPQNAEVAVPLPETDPDNVSGISRRMRIDVFNNEMYVHFGNRLHKFQESVFEEIHRFDNYKNYLGQTSSGLVFHEPSSAIVEDHFVIFDIVIGEFVPTPDNGIVPAPPIFAYYQLEDHILFSTKGDVDSKYDWFVLDNENRISKVASNAEPIQLFDLLITNRGGVGRTVTGGIDRELFLLDVADRMLNKLDINTRSASSFPRYFQVENNTLYFMAETKEGKEVFSIDTRGISSKVLAKRSNEYISKFIVIEDQVIYGSHGSEFKLYFEDLESGVRTGVDIDGLVGGFTRFSDIDQFYFTTYLSGNSSLWVSNGTIETTSKVGDLGDAKLFEGFQTGKAAWYSGELYFVMDVNNDFVDELWKVNSDNSIDQISISGYHYISIEVLEDRLVLYEHRADNSNAIYQLEQDDNIQELISFKDNRSAIAVVSDTLVVIGDDILETVVNAVRDSIWALPQGHHFETEMLVDKSDVIFFSSTNQDLFIWRFSPYSNTIEPLDTIQGYSAASSGYQSKEFVFINVFPAASSRSDLYQLNVNTGESIIFENVRLGEAQTLSNKLFFVNSAPLDVELWAMDLPLPSLSVELSGYGTLINEDVIDLGRFNIDSLQSLDYELLATNVGLDSLEIFNIHFNTTLGGLDITYQEVSELTLAPGETSAIAFTVSFESALMESIGVTVISNAPDQENQLYTFNIEIFQEIEELPLNINPLPNLKIYPNPADQELRIELPDLSISSIRMIDLSGKIWHERMTQSATLTIDVTHLPTGIYALQLQTITGEQTTRKVLIQR